MASSDDETDSSLSSPTAMSSRSLSPNYMRATASSSARKGSFHESSGHSSVHVCSYSYCSLNGHRHCHHAPSPTLTEFISAKRLLIKKQKDKQSLQNDAGPNFLITTSTMPRKKWAAEGSQTRATNYDRELAEASSKKALPKGRREALNRDLQEPHEIFSICSVVATSNETVESLIGEGKALISSGDDLINILSDKRRYTNIWNLICQQLVSTDMPETRNVGISVTDENKGVDVNDNDKAATENSVFDQTEAVKFVQEAISAILQHDTNLNGHQSKPDQETTYSLAEKLSGTTMQGEVDPTEGEMTQKQMAKSSINLRKVFVTAKIIKAVERMKKISPRPPQYLFGQPALEEEKVYLRHITGDERKNTEEWMLDYALRQVILRLDPGQQRRVAQLVDAFEIVTQANDEPEKLMFIPDEQASSQQDDAVLLSHNKCPEEIRLMGTPEVQTKATDSPLESAGNSCKPVDNAIDGGMIEEFKTTPLESLDKFHDSQASPAGRDDIVLQETAHTSISESALQYIQNCSMPTPADVESEVLSIGAEEITNNAEIFCSIEYERQVVENSMIYVDQCPKAQNDRLSFPSDAPFERNQQEDYHIDISSARTELSSKCQDSEQTNLHINHLVRPKDCPLENPLIVKKEEVKVSIPEIPRHASLSEYRQQDCQQTILSDKQKVVFQLSAEIDTEGNTDNFSRFSPGVTHENGMDTPTRKSFDFHENEAIKLIQEAINELFILPEQASDSTTSEDADCNHIFGNGREPLSVKVDTTATTKGQKTSPRENSSSTYSKLSKVIMCKKFIKEINKMRKIKLQSRQELSCTTHPEEGEAPSLRHTATGEKKSWEEWMLDHVLQQVIQKLSQAQKKRVALLIQAFETVGSQPEPTTSTSLRGEASIS